MEGDEGDEGAMPAAFRCELRLPRVVRLANWLWKPAPAKAHAEPAGNAVCTLGRTGGSGLGWRRGCRCSGCRPMQEAWMKVAWMQEVWMQGVWMQEAVAAVLAKAETKS